MSAWKDGIRAVRQYSRIAGRKNGSSGRKEEKRYRMVLVLYSLAITGLYGCVEELARILTQGVCKNAHIPHYICCCSWTSYNMTADKRSSDKSAANK